MQESVLKITLIGLMSSLFYRESNIISIWNNGKGIPVVEHKVEKVYVPALIFGQLLTSSNYDDDEKKVTGKMFCFIQLSHCLLFSMLSLLTFSLSVLFHNR